MRLGSILIPLTLLCACSGDGDLAGGEGEACRPGGGCNPGLSCLAEICVSSPDASIHDAWQEPGFDWQGSDWDLPPPDAPLPADKGQPAHDGPLAKPDAPMPKLDKGVQPTQCKQWSGWGCIKNPRYGVVCWSTCPGAKGAIWCDGVGNCHCTGATGSCAKVKVDLSKPCDACKAALEQHGCCKP
jgi:hypothetical protein